MPLLDAYGRVIRDLRISVTDRCNFRCFYCLPNGEPALARKETILTFEEIARASRIFVSLGIEKIRITGGEPLIRKDLPRLVEALAVFKPALKDLALTTNGFDLARHAAALKSAGLDRITLSLDSVERTNFEDITGVDALGKVLDSISAAKDAGFEKLKVNAVIVRGRNDREVVALAQFARENALAMRFIEYMPLDSAHGWNRDEVVSGREILETIREAFPLELISNSRGSETSWRYRFADGSPGEIGIIAPVTEMFCGACSRIRLTADGQICTCLFSTVEYDLRTLLRSTDIERRIADFIEECVLLKEERHHINDAEFVPASRSMSFIGG